MESEKKNPTDVGQGDRHDDICVDGVEMANISDD